MTTQPTAAPWKVTIEPTHIPGIIRARIEPAGGPYRGSIAHLQNVDWDGGIGPDEMTANAHLLGAARDLLDFVADFATADFAALRSFHIDPQDEEDPVTDAEHVWAWQQDARAALAKARGKA